MICCYSSFSSCSYFCFTVTATAYKRHRRLLSEKQLPSSYHSLQFLSLFPCILVRAWSRIIFYAVVVLSTSLVAQIVKNLPAIQETPVQSLGLEGPLEKELATYSSTLVWRLSWTEEPGRLQFLRLQRVGLGRLTFTFHFQSCPYSML